MDQKVLDSLDDATKPKFEALTREQRDQYAALYLAVGDDSRSALARLLADGRLIGVKSLRDDKDVLGQLATLLKPENLAPTLRPDHHDTTSRTGMQQLPYVEQLIRETADPGLISQRSHNTCGATTVEYMLAKTNPSEFVRLASELASPRGKTRLAGGERLDIADTHGLDMDQSGRTDVDRLMQSALMDAARIHFFGFGNHYDNRTDKGSVAPNVPGFSPTEMDKVLGQVLKQNRIAMLTPNHPQDGVVSFFGNLVHEGADLLSPLGALNSHLRNFLDTYRSHSMNEILDRVQHSLDKGGMVPVLTTFTSGQDVRSKVESLHYLAIVGVDREKGTVTLRNPWGSGEDGGGQGNPARSLVPGADAGTITMTVTEFEKVARVVFPEK